MHDAVFFLGYFGSTCFHAMNRITRMISMTAEQWELLEQAVSTYEDCGNWPDGYQSQAMIETARIVRAALTKPKPRTRAEIIALAAQAVQLHATSSPKMTYMEIAAKLGISYWTVRHYIYKQVKCTYALGR